MPAALHDDLCIRFLQQSFSAVLVVSLGPRSHSETLTAVPASFPCVSVSQLSLPCFPVFPSHSCLCLVTLGFDLTDVSASLHYFGLTAVSALFALYCLSFSLFPPRFSVFPYHCCFCLVLMCFSRIAVSAVCAGLRSQAFEKRQAELQEREQHPLTAHTQAPPLPPPLPLYAFLELPLRVFSDIPHVLQHLTRSEFTFGTCATSFLFRASSEIVFRHSSRAAASYPP